MKNNTAISIFDPVGGGRYANGDLRDESNARWFGSEIYNSVVRYYLGYSGNSLTVAEGRLYMGVYIRCVSEEKTVLDLTYMQDNDGEKGGGLWAYKT